MYWVQGQYVRRAGYWLAAQPNWVWAPSHYVVTPRGYIFAEGHWDYSLERRGVLFAPVYFPASVYGRSDFTYSPSIVIDMGLLRVNLFAYPRYSHYYFGDYYDDAYLRIGIYPWFDSQRLHTWYDPIYEHDRWRNRRSEPRWEERERGKYNRRRADKDLRPARTYREQKSRLVKLREPLPHVVGGSGVQGIFQRGPPARPADEDRVKEGRDIRRNRAADMDTRKDRRERHGD
jgi:hypothetical protein